MNDVPPEEATVSGNIISIARYTAGSNTDNEYLALAADGGLRYKLASNQTHGSWNTYDVTQVINGFSYHAYDYYNSTHNGYQILKVLADSNYLYLFCASYKNDSDSGITVTDTFYIWGIKPTVNADGTWSTENCEVKTVSIPDDTFPTYISSEIQYSAFSIFSTNAPQKNNRRVYIRTGKLDTSYSTITYFQLSDGTISSAGSLTPADSSDTNQISSVVMFNGSPVFFNSKAATTNETYSSAASRIYYGNGSSLYYSDTSGSNFTSALDASYQITSLTTTADSILIGRGTEYDSTSTTSSTGGVVRTSLTDGVPASALVDFTSNASFKLTSAYYILTTINASPDQTEANSSLYATMTFSGTGSSSSSVSYDDIGLWSYYPARGNWNRE
ncbi:MAG: hypothetical protein K6C97_11525 [Treponema sp.]|nr:hypothetical protein [Treponema sp.]